jgi:hypothetical protein
MRGIHDRDGAPAPGGSAAGRSIVRSGLGAGVSIASLAALLVSLPEGRRGFVWFLVASTAGLVLLAGARKGLEHGSDQTFRLVLGGAILLSRLCWVLWMPTLPVSDFEEYQGSAAQMARGVWAFPAYQEGGYPLLLSVLFRVWGAGPWPAKGLNIVLSIGTGLLLFEIGRHSLGPGLARTAALLFALWPAQVMFSSVLASELPFTALLYAALLLLLVRQKSHTRSLAVLALAGVLMGLSNAVRPAAIPVLCISVLWLLGRPGASRTRLFGALALACGFSLAFGAYLALQARLGGIPPSRSSLPINILCGSNPRSGGLWNPEDAALARALVAERGARGAILGALGVAWERVGSHPRLLLGLLRTKFHLMWGTDNFGAFWSTAVVQPTRAGLALQAHARLLAAASHVFWSVVLALGALGGLYYVRGPLPDGGVLLFAILLGFVLLHTLLEVQARYHYPWAGVLFLAAARGLDRLRP